jgi:hypothetical protein
MAGSLEESCAVGVKKIRIFYANNAYSSRKNKKNKKLEEKGLT